MATKQAAVQAFLSSFGVPAYPASAVPEQAEMPYLTYELPIGAWGDGDASMLVNLWCRTESEAEPNARAARLAERLGLGGVVLACDGGAMWLRRGSPFCQPVADTDPSVKRRYINIDIEYLTTF